MLKTNQDRQLKVTQAITYLKENKNFTEKVLKQIVQSFKSIFRNSITLLHITAHSVVESHTPMMDASLMSVSEALIQQYLRCANLPT